MDGFAEAKKAHEKWGDGAINGCANVTDEIGVEIESDDVRSYFSSALPRESYFTGAVSVHDLEQIKAEIGTGAWPGEILARFGLVPIGGTIGGGQVCVSGKDGKVRFADSSYISDRWVMAPDESGKLATKELTEENLLSALPLVSEDLVAFFSDLVEGEMNAKLDKLDEG